MQRLQGIGVSPGVAIGEAIVIGQEGFRIPRRFVARDAVENELERLAHAIDSAASEVDRNRERVSEQLGDQYAAIFSAHLQMLRDPRLRGELEELIRQRHYSPEYAISRALRRYAKVFQTLEGGFLSERASDIFDIEKRLLRHLLGKEREELAEITSPVVVLAHELTPSETANLNANFVLGFVTEIGGLGSHTAIVAEGLGIPAVLGLGSFLTDVSGGDTVIIDGDHGQVILNPTDETLARYQQEVEDHRTAAERLEEIRELPAETTDGQRIQLLANIEFPAEVEHCGRRGGDGIGLYRTEFLYLGAQEEPTEEDHYQAYAQVLQAMPDKPVVIRTLDLGADKIPGHGVRDYERNPFLGLRSIRLSLANNNLFRTQLRAIMRASTKGNPRIMFPMVSTVMELRQAKSLLADAMEDLEEEGIEFNENVPVGMMVEVPAAVILLDRFIEEVDFVSIGTNDLVQFTLAVDRSNHNVAHLYTSADPAVLRLIKQAVDVADSRGVPVSLCGQMSGNPRYTMLLLGLGLRSLSVTPSAIPEIKRVCRAVSLEQCQAVANHALSLDSARDVKTLLNEEIGKIIPDLPL